MDKTEKLIKDIENVRFKLSTYIMPQSIEYYNTALAKELIELGYIKISDLENILQDFAEKIKMRFYYNFDEVIPSIMSDEIDKILNETLDKSGEIK